jgi:hypothetical protein
MSGDEACAVSHVHVCVRGHDVVVCAYLSIHVPTSLSAFRRVWVGGCPYVYVYAYY